MMIYKGQAKHNTNDPNDLSYYTCDKSFNLLLASYQRASPVECKLLRSAYLKHDGSLNARIGAAAAHKDCGRLFGSYSIFFFQTEICYTVYWDAIR